MSVTVNVEFELVEENDIYVWEVWVNKERVAFDDVFREDGHFLTAYSSELRAYKALMNWVKRFRV